MNWYESSIKSLIEEYFEDHSFSLLFNPCEFWDVNMKHWLEQIPISLRDEFIRTANSARAYAFDKKYGAYAYDTDYRSVCNNWNHIILDEIHKVVGMDLSGKKVLAVGANNGSELSIIFEETFEEMDFTVVEISKSACENGRARYPHINFLCSSMDEAIVPENKFDIFMSLRAAYCAGNNLDFIVQKALHSVMPGGIIMFSISNGYIDVTDGKHTPIKGVYNPENHHCDEDETAINIRWMYDAMSANGCNNIYLVDAESEILLIAKR